jgi:transcriptional regulator with XRE-family HTH domain
MNEFARILSELIDRGKAEKHFNIQTLAQHAGITASYLSNIKQANRKPPAHKTLIKITDTLRNFGVPETDIQRLIEAYNRTQLEPQKESNLLSLLIETYDREGGFLKRLRHHVQTSDFTHVSETRTLLEREPLKNSFIEGDWQTFLLQAIQLFEHATEVDHPTGRLYITWLQCLTEREMHDPSSQTLHNFLEALRSFLWADSPVKVFFLCAGGITHNLRLIQRFLKEFIGTSNCLLYEIPNGAYQPQYFVIEHVGFVEARPKSDDLYWIRTVVLEEAETERPNELWALIAHFEYLLGSQDCQPVVQTMASLEKFTVASGLKKLAEAERQHFQEERLLIKSSFSTLYWPAKTLRAKLQALQLPQDRIEAYLHYHFERTNTLYKRLEHGKERAIHPRHMFSQEFSISLKKAFAENSRKYAVSKAEVELMKGQLLQALQVITRHANFHFALTTQKLPIAFTLTGDTVFFGLDLPHVYEALQDEHQQLEAIAWTCHPEVIYHLQREFDEKWKNIDDQWRTDTEEGRRNVVAFLVTEAIKIFLRANVPTQELWSFMQALTDTADCFDAESFTRELYLQEQVAKDIFIICNSLPTITMPVNSGPWKPRSAFRTRQRLFPSILQEVESFYVVSMQEGIEQYWNTRQYRQHPFKKEWITRHFHAVHDLLDSSDKIAIALLPMPEQIPVNVEIVDQEFVCIESTMKDGNTGGLILHEKTLAQKLRIYVERNLLARCPEHFKGARNVAKWLEERFGG